MADQGGGSAALYRYQPKLGAALIGTGIFLLFLLGMSYVAMDNDRGLVINGLIKLDASSATAFYWMLTMLCAGMSVFGLNAIRLALMKERKITLSRTEIIIPPTWPGQENTTIPFRAITDLQLETTKSSRVAIIISDLGKTRFTQRFFEDKASFDDCLTRLLDAIKIRANGHPE